MSAATIIQLIYLVSTGAFILSLRWMSDPRTARRGVFAGVSAMALAIGGTLLLPEIEAFHWIALAFVLGTIVGFYFGSTDDGSGRFVLADLRLSGRVFAPTISSDRSIADRSRTAMI